MMPEYVLNAWYVAAWEEEIEGDSWLPRRLLDLPRLLYRRRDGSYVMLEDRCPHRFAPLHLGRRNGDDVICRYHGLSFDSTGACNRTPSGDAPPAHVRVTATPVTARHGLLWFWPGDPAAADPALIPDFSFLDAQHVWRRKSTFAGNYELLADNLMDLSHVDHLHGATFGTQGSQARARHEVYEGPAHTLWSDWTISDAPKLPFLARVLGDGKVDQLLQMRWSAPASMALNIVWMPHGGRPDQALFSMINPHIVTPESASTSHYFWTCEPSVESEALARAVFDTEDKPMIEAVQAAMRDADFWHLKPAIVRQDLAAIRARRRLMRLRHEERPSAQ